VRVFAVKTCSAGAAPSSRASPEKAGPPRLSIVVLPFANLGGDPEQEYFVDGLTESLTTDRRASPAHSSLGATLPSPIKENMLI
jgi:TolB-like protein